MATDGPPHRSVEIAVAIICLIFGGITIFGSLSAGIGWGRKVRSPDSFRSTSA